MSQTLTGQPYRNFIETVHSPYTRMVYTTLQLYMRFRKVNNCSQLLQGDLRLIQSQLIEYIIYLREDRKLGSNSINTNMAGVKKFYETNDIELKWAKIKSYVGKGKRMREGKKDRPYNVRLCLSMLSQSQILIKTMKEDYLKSDMRYEQPQVRRKMTQETDLRQKSNGTAMNKTVILWLIK